MQASGPPEGGSVVAVASQKGLPRTMARVGGAASAEHDDRPDPTRRTGVIERPRQGVTMPPLTFRVSPET